MGKDWYIRQISDASDRRGNLLLQMMDEYGCNNLQELSLEQVQEFYKKLKGDFVDE